MNNDAFRPDLKRSIFFLLFSMLIQLCMGSSIWQLCNSFEKTKNENKLNLSLMVPLEFEEIIEKEPPKEILHLPEMDDIKPQAVEMAIDEIMPVDPFEVPRIMEQPEIPKIEPAPKKKKKETRKEAPKIVQPEKKEVAVEKIKEPVENTNTVPVSIPAPVPVKEKKEVPQIPPKPTLTKSQLNENSKYLAKVMKIFEKNKTYPKNARATHTEGKIIVSFCIDKEGNTNNVVAKTKNPKILATAAEELVGKSHLPAPPKHWDNSARVELPIMYKLR